MTKAAKSKVVKLLTHREQGLLKRFYSLQQTIIWSVKKYESDGLSDDEIHDFVRDAFIEAARKYDENRGPFPPFARTVVRRRKKDAIGRKSREVKAMNCYDGYFRDKIENPLNATEEEQLTNHQAAANILYMFGLVSKYSSNQSQPCELWRVELAKKVEAALVKMGSVLGEDRSKLMRLRYLEDGGTTWASAAHQLGICSRTAYRHRHEAIQWLTKNLREFAQN